MTERAKGCACHRSGYCGRLTAASLSMSKSIVCICQNGPKGIECRIKVPDTTDWHTRGFMPDFPTQLSTVFDRRSTMSIAFWDCSASAGLKQRVLLNKKPKGNQGLRRNSGVSKQTNNVRVEPADGLGRLKLSILGLRSQVHTVLVPARRTDWGPGLT